MASMSPLVMQIMKDLKISSTSMGSILGAWPLIYILLAIPCGSFIDKVGLKWSLLLAALIMGISSLARAFAFDYWTLFFAVAIFGIGGPLISIGAPKLISQFFQGKERGLAMGIYITGPGLGSIFALTLTNSVFTPMFDGNWRGVMMLYGVIVFIAGFVWFLCSLFLKIENDNYISNNQINQLKVYFNLLSLRPVQIILLMSIFIFFFSHGLNNWLPEILRSTGMSLTNAGYWAALPTIAGTIGSLIIPKYALPNRRFFILFILILSAALSTLLLLFNFLPILSIGLVLQGISRGSLMTIAILVLMETKGVSSKNMGAAGGLFFTFAELGGVLGPLSIGIGLDLTGGFAESLIFMFGICIFLFMLLFILKNKKGF